MDGNHIKNQQGDLPVDDSIDESSHNMLYTQLIQEHVFLGEYPFNSIIEGIQKQFEDYINDDYKINYVDIFFNQLHGSYNAVKLDDSEEHPVEIKEILDRIHWEFVHVISSLFNDRLNITIVDIENGNINNPDVEFIIKNLYEFFILDVRNNFKFVISKDLMNSVNGEIADYNSFIDESFTNYSPLITTITPVRFLQYAGNQEILNLFEDDKFIGNFLKKYSPKLYQNEEFKNELANYVSIALNFKNRISLTNKI